MNGQCKIGLIRKDYVCDHCRERKYCEIGNPYNESLLNKEMLLVFIFIVLVVSLWPKGVD